MYAKKTLLCKHLSLFNTSNMCVLPALLRNISDLDILCLVHGRTVAETLKYVLHNDYFCSCTIFLISSLVSVENDGHLELLESVSNTNVPDVVAAETVVRTTHSRPAHVQVVKSKSKADSLAEEITGTSVLTTSCRYDV